MIYIAEQINLSIDDFDSLDHSCLHPEARQQKHEPVCLILYEPVCLILYEARLGRQAIIQVELVPQTRIQVLELQLLCICGPNWTKSQQQSS